MATVRVSFLLGGERFHGRLNRCSVLSDVPAKATRVNRAGPGYKVITAADIARFKTRNDAGQMVPVGSVARFRDISGPYRLPRYNQFPAAEVQGSAAPGVSSGTALAAMEELAAQRLPKGVGFAWTDLGYEQKQAGNSDILHFGASEL